VNENRRALLAVGTRLAYDGQWWQVSELDGAHVLLTSQAGSLRQVSAGHLLADPGTRLQGTPADLAEGAGADMAGLSEAELAELRERVAHVQEVRTGFRRGCAELAADGEPRPEYSPGVPMLTRYAAKAAEIGVGVSTLRRWVKDFEADGPAGLADDRWRRRSPLVGADPRWLEMVRLVLAEHTEASKPTQDLILAEVAARLDAEHGDGAVPVPAPTRARILLRQISKGTSAFGGTKAKREIAGRPATPYGRLRAMRPGEYLLLDTARLDVFAMDPVTLRWVQCELTAGMDLYDRCITGLRLTPGSTKAVDAAAVLFESVRPLPQPAAGQVGLPPPYHGLPGQVIIDVAKLADQDGEPLLPSVAAETIVVDHGKIYLSEHLMSACARLGISIQPGRVYQAATKGLWNTGSGPSASSCWLRCPATKARMSTGAARTPSSRRSTSWTN